MMYHDFRPPTGQSLQASLWLALILVLALAAIAFRPSLAQEVSDDEVRSVADHMHEHLTRISTIKAAIVAGDLDGVREPATWLADHETAKGLPEDFEPYVAQMKTYARHVIQAQNSVIAAQLISKMAKTCGNCHLVNDVNLEFGYDRLPREDIEDVVTHMQRHQWAADRLWEGLIGPSDSAWNRGADMLIDVPLVPEDVTTMTEHYGKISEYAHRVHALGGIGTETATPDARSELYGELLGLCASCHVLLGRGPAN